MTGARDYSLNIGTTKGTWEMKNVKQIKIWNTHYQAATDTWRVTVIWTTGKEFTSPLAMPMSEVQDYINQYVLVHMPVSK
jgi:hypothetical protein